MRQTKSRLMVALFTLQRLQKRIVCCCQDEYNEYLHISVSSFRCAHPNLNGNYYRQQFTLDHKMASTINTCLNCQSGKNPYRVRFVIQSFTSECFVLRNRNCASCSCFGCGVASGSSALRSSEWGDDSSPLSVPS